MDCYDGFSGTKEVIGSCKVTYLATALIRLNRSFMNNRYKSIISFLTSVFVILLAPLFGGVEDHLKKATDKEGPYQMRNIDFIYMINLDQRPEKYASSFDQLAPYGVTPYRFSAVNGWELSLKDINDVGIKYEPWMRQGLMGTYYLVENKGEPQHEIMSVLGRNYFCHCMSVGAIGIALSHLSILKDALDSGYETIWVMEDDIEVIRDPHLISDLIEKLDAQVGKEGWDFLFTDFDTKNNSGAYVPCTGAAFRPNFPYMDHDRFVIRFDISPEFRKIGARYGAYSMIVRKSGMEKMLNFMRNGIFLPYDMEYTLPDVRMFTVREDVVSTQINALSDNGAPNYKIKLIQQ
jgi:GR25 family glycosyltransferase involved in LPS biosynthesis